MPMPTTEPQPFRAAIAENPCDECGKVAVCFNDPRTLRRYCYKCYTDPARVAAAKKAEEERWTRTDPTRPYDPRWDEP